MARVFRCRRFCKAKCPTRWTCIHCWQIAAAMFRLRICDRSLFWKRLLRNILQRSRSDSRRFAASHWCIETHTKGSGRRTGGGCSHPSMYWKAQDYGYTGCCILIRQGFQANPRNQVLQSLRKGRSCKRRRCPLNLPHLARPVLSVLARRTNTRHRQPFPPRHK